MPTTRELESIISKKCGVPAVQVHTVLAALAESVQEYVMDRGAVVIITRLGTFSRSTVAPRHYRHPKTGAVGVSKAKHKLFFRPLPAKK